MSSDMARANYSDLSGLNSLWRDGALCLAYERSRAPSTAAALRLWSAGQFARWQRLRRIGVHPFLTLLKLEAACAELGLIFGVQGCGQSAPWHLPESLLDPATDALPAHPLLDRATLQSAAKSDRGIDALTCLLLGKGFASQWIALELVNQLPIPASGARIAVCLHLYYPELWSEIRDALENLPEPWDLYVSVPMFAATPVLAAMVRDKPGLKFLPVINRGRDVLPFVHLIASGTFSRYDWVCKLHTKRSPHISGGDNWRSALLQGLVGTEVQSSRRLAQLRADPSAGMAGSARNLITVGQEHFLGTNSSGLARLRNQLNLGLPASALPFFAGTMFWFRPIAFAGLIEVADKKNFPIEMGQTDGTTAHALERLMPEIVAQAGFHTVTLD